MTTDTSQASRPRQWREWVQFGILVFGVGWGVFTFILKDIWAPARRPGALDILSSLDEVGRAKADRLIRVRIIAANSSDRRIYVPALWYTVWGEGIARADAAAFLKALRSAPALSMTARHSKIVAAVVVASGRIAIENGTWYEPHDKTTNEAVFTIPAQGYDVLELQIKYIVTRDTVGLGSPRWDVLPSGEWMPTIMMKSKGRDSLEAFDDSNPRHRKWEHDNGVGFNWSVATLSLWPQVGSP